MLINTSCCYTVRALAAIFAAGVLCSNALAQTRQAQSIVGVTNSAISGFVGSLDFESSNTGALSVASIDRSFTGMDRSGTTQTMNFGGETRTSADFGRLRSFTTGTVTNTYYNSANPIYYNSGTNTTNPDGSPDGLVSLGFAIFDDTLQFGGSLEAGYKARYLFHIDGTNSGYGALASLSVSLAGNPAENFFLATPGFHSQTFATKTYEINGSTPQTIHVQFSTQFVLNTFDVNDGSNISGTANFSATASLIEVQVVDSNGNPVSGVTYSSASGTTYVPEPGALSVLFPAFLLHKRRRTK